MRASAAEMEKLTVQRGAYQRLRDEAGSRLRAAGAEFATLNSKLSAMAEARDKFRLICYFCELKETMQCLRYKNCLE